LTKDEVRKIATKSKEELEHLKLGSGYVKEKGLKINVKM